MRDYKSVFEGTYRTGFNFLYLEKDKLTEFIPIWRTRSLLGNICVGKVKHVVKNIDAAFVEIAGGQTCYLPFKEAQAPVLTNRRWDGRLLAGDEILVQVMRDALKTKEPALTAKISLEGRLAAVVLDGGHGVRYSRQLPGEAADHFREVLQSVTVPDGMTLVVRTAAGDGWNSKPADTALLREANALLEKAQKLLSVGRSRTVFSMISEERPGWLIELLSHKQLPDKIVTDETLVYTALEDLYGSGASGTEKRVPAVAADSVERFGKRTQELQGGTKCPKISFYRDSRPNLFALYGLAGKLEEALLKRVWLKSGGYLVIEPTEALTVIDVNTGKYDGSKNVEETFALINREAAQETARQIRLRNLSGIILIDFINQKDRQAAKELLEELRSLCKEDPVPVCVVDITALGLVELTRKKVKGTAEQLKGLKPTEIAAIKIDQTGRKGMEISWHERCGTANI